jgi:hypothetical protein
LRSGLSNHADKDYTQEKDLYTRLLNLPQYAEWKDIILDNLCALEFSRGNWSEVLKTCSLIDDYYTGLPSSEKGRLLRNARRARAIFKAGQKKEGISVLGDLTKDRYAAIRKKVFLREIEEMRHETAAAEKTGGCGSDQPTTATQPAASSGSCGSTEASPKPVSSSAGDGCGCGCGSPAPREAARQPAPRPGAAAQ